MMQRRHAAWIALAFTTLAAQAQEPKPADFAWRARLDVPPNASLARVSLPADALSLLQTANAADVRVFDGKGGAVPFARAGAGPAEQAPPAQTAAFAALPLHSAQAGAKLPKGAVQVRAQDGAGASVWVQIGGAPAAAAAPASQRLPAALFDTRALKEPVAELVLAGQWPANAPIAVRVSTSPDLASWTPVATRGRIYRFEGAGAPSNNVLRLAEPLRLEQQFLRLDWAGQDDMAITSVTGVHPPKVVPPEKPSLLLNRPQREGANALVWELSFATPIAELELAAAPNTLLPVRVLGRNQVSEPWRTLGHTVVYRLGDGPEGRNTPLVLQRPSVRWLRVEATHGQQIGERALTAKVLWDPLQLAFVAGGERPLQVAAGRAGTAAAALPLAMLTSTGSVKFEALPLATVLAGEFGPPPATSVLQAFLPRGVDAKAAGLWAVLGLGVLVLGGVAWSLLRQLKEQAAPPSQG